VELPAALTPLVDDAAHAAIVTDFDGTLAPIVDDPAAARVLPAAHDALARCVPLVARVAVVSGRPVSFLARALGIAGVEHIGVYGLERVADGEVVADRRAVPWLDAVATALSAARSALPGLLVEDKNGLTVTVHWRSAPEREAEARVYVEELRRRTGLRVHEARAALELRPPVAVDKGTVVRELASGMAVVAVAGDDVGDVAAFHAVTALAHDHAVASAVRIGVASAEAPPEIFDADMVVDGPEGLAALLDALADALSEGRRGR
jgi:trehalose 6-phosphate phosphatase